MLNKLAVNDNNQPFTIDSRDVAAMVGKEHNMLLRDIRNYIKLGGSNFAHTDYFIESTYVDSQNRENPRYLVTRKGCEMIANKITGQKGVLFTAAYIEKFHEMEKRLQPALRPSSPATKTSVSKSKRRTRAPKRPVCTCA